MVFWVLALILCKLTTLNDQWSFSAQFWLWFCPILYRLNCLEDSLSGQGAFTARLDTLERSAANCDERISDVLSRMESFCPDNVSVNNRRAFPSNRGPRGRGRPHIVSSSDRRFESKSREFNVPRKRGSESFRSSNRDGPPRHYWKDFDIWGHFEMIISFPSCHFDFPIGKFYFRFIITFNAWFYSWVFQLSVLQDSIPLLRFVVIA